MIKTTTWTSAKPWACFMRLVSYIADDSLKFIVMGDWGGLPDFPYRTAIERAVAKEMGNIADDIDSQFVLALGDNFYFDGVMTVEDARFQVRAYLNIFCSIS